MNKVKKKKIKLKLNNLLSRDHLEVLKRTFIKIQHHQLNKIIILLCLIVPSFSCIKSISSNQSRKSRDSDLLNKLAKDKDKSKSSSKPRDRNNSSMQLQSSLNMTSKSNSAMSEEQINIVTNQKKQITKQPPKIHNCVCFVAEQCLSYNCNCFLSPFPCTPQCCPNCITLKSSLPLKISNSCNCKKTRCLKLYCQCLAKGLYCTIMCRCELCENHEHSTQRKQLQNFFKNEIQKGCSCRKTNCEKKYCECYAQQKKCTKSCKCTNCNNFQQQIFQYIPVVPKIINEKKPAETAIQTMIFQQPDFSMQPKKKKR